VLKDKAAQVERENKQTGKNLKFHIRARVLREKQIEFCQRIEKTINLQSRGMLQFNSSWFQDHHCNIRNGKCTKANSFKFILLLDNSIQFLKAIFDAQTGFVLGLL
jgi:hypothetical protein